MPLVIYAILAEQNIAKLFAAAMIPGLIAMIGYVIAIAIYVRLVPGHAPDARRSARADDGPRVAAAWRRSRIIFIIVFGGIYGGKFTPTEGAAVGAASTFLAALAKGEMTLRQVQALFLRHGRSLGDDLHDLPRRRPDELGAGADPGARPAGGSWCRLGPDAAVRW